jgi:hypothetical protein
MDVKRLNNKIVKCKTWMYSIILIPPGNIYDVNRMTGGFNK